MHYDVFPFLFTSSPQLGPQVQKTMVALTTDYLSFIIFLERLLSPTLADFGHFEISSQWLLSENFN